MPRGATFGKLIGIYTGTVVEEASGDYVMTMWAGGPMVRGGTDTLRSMNKMCRINDPLGDAARLNCVVLEGGLIYQTKSIKRNEELFINYGPEYNWDALKSSYLSSSLTGHIQAAAHYLQITFSLQLPPAHPRDLERWRTSSGLTRLLVDFLDHDEGLQGTNDFPLAFYPGERQDELEWLELLLRSKHFLGHYGFKGAHRR